MQHPNKGVVCLVVVGHNEEEAVPRVIAGIREVMASQPHHIIVISDGSTDNMAEKARQQADYVIEREHRGLGFSVREGFQYAHDHGFGIIINMDADGQHDPSVLGRFVPCLQNGSRVVKATRFHPESMVVGEIPKDRQILNQELAQQISGIVEYPVTDALCGMFGFKREVLTRLLPHLMFNGYGLCLEKIIKLSKLLPDVPPPREIVHPAIYLRDTTRHMEKYSETKAAVAERMRRLDMHRQHIQTALAYCENIA